jgi:hypothetical protein
MALGHFASTLDYAALPAGAFREFGGTEEPETGSRGDLARKMMALDPTGALINSKGRAGSRGHLRRQEPSGSLPTMIALATGFLFGGHPQVRTASSGRPSIVETSGPAGTIRPRSCDDSTIALRSCEGGPTPSSGSESLRPARGTPHRTRWADAAGSWTPASAASSLICGAIA